MRPIRWHAAIDHAAARRWCMGFACGLASLTLVVCVFAWPGLSFAGLLFAYGGYCAVDGVVAIAGGLSASLSQSIASGTVSLLVAILAFGSAVVTVVVLLS